MRTKIIAGNWKMNNDISETQILIRKLIKGLEHLNTNCRIIICPPFTSLISAEELIRNTKIKLGAQNMYPQEGGAFTGEVSASMLISAGCEYVIFGHSERRTIFKETDDLINKKILFALKKGLKPIFCVGETELEREMNETKKVIERQVKLGLQNVSSEDIENIILAYEPVWAIGTGKNATPGQAQEVHSFIRNLIENIFSPAASSKIVIQYGGSVKPGNAKELLSQTDIDGALVGGASLKAEDFLGIISAA